MRRRFFLVPDSNDLFVHQPEKNPRFDVKKHALTSVSDKDFILNTLNTLFEEQQNLLLNRLYGVLPTVAILGNTFRVDIKAGRLMQSDHPESEGISIIKLRDYCDEDKQKYVFPYNPSSRELVELDRKTIEQMPEHLKMISIPHVSIMDPLGYRNKYGWAPPTTLRGGNYKTSFVAKEVAWQKTWVLDAIHKNQRRKRFDSQAQINRLESFKSKPGKGRKKRRM